MSETIMVYRDENLLVPMRSVLPEFILINTISDDNAEVAIDGSYKCPDCKGQGMDEDGAPCWCDDGTIRILKLGYISRRDADWLQSGEHFQALLKLRYGSDRPASIADWWTGQTKPIFTSTILF